MIKLTITQRRALLAVAHRGVATLDSDTLVTEERTTIKSGIARKLSKLKLVTINLQSRRVKLTDEGRNVVAQLNQRGQST